MYEHTHFAIGLLRVPHKQADIEEFANRCGRETNCIVIATLSQPEEYRLEATGFWLHLNRLKTATSHIVEWGDVKEIPQEEEILDDLDF